ncbi:MULTISPECIES: MBL fold metallo-hydrolase [unclassified Rothia (in: high G+C Gram-positive bacteria)]|uniref:MBL fold metallo-hydrolase n=1 Tax=unclassified Rothia (in: high G+C Gram-positive bacteria) TaxID=2689056 RepID=UPI001957F074|nr:MULTISPECIES: MBL fold metallo-hydrolase [unclassified Rothia (in: high G+C Gram-positive bacteria)]MBM7051923.1 MBL fold metallo-hydrolase [Rothia sp. ZJ1223]QRZ62002.1 MBL fold metallo-hydrolase [Rothia sp. ZJ932]
MARTTEIADGIYLIATDNYRLNTGLIVGTDEAMVVDTGAGPRQGAEVLRAIRRITDLPLVVVNTHTHFDRFMGNAVFEADGVTDFWAHSRAAKAIETYGDRQRSYVEVLEPEMAHAKGPNTQLVVPTRLLPGDGTRASFTRVDLGERAVTLFYLGLAHTDNDVLVGVDDVLFAGDIVEQGSDPAFDDAYPDQWVSTLKQVAALDRYRIFVPGHGIPVESSFVERMAETMEDAIHRIRESKVAKGASTTAAMYKLPYTPGATRILLDRLTWLEQKEEAGVNLNDVEFGADIRTDLAGPITLGEGQ